MMVDFMGGLESMLVAHDPVRKVCNFSGSCLASAAPTYHAAPSDEFTPKAQIRRWLMRSYRSDTRCRTLPLVAWVPVDVTYQRHFAFRADMMDMIAPFGRPNDLRYENGLESCRQVRAASGHPGSPRSGSPVREG